MNLNFYTSNFKRFNGTFGISLGIILLIFGIMTELLIRYYIEQHDFVTRHAKLFQNTEKKIAAFGDSHVAVGMNSRNPDFINLAFPSDNITTIAHKIRNYFRRVQPDKIIIQADAHLFALYRRIERLDYNQLFNDNYTWNNVPLRVAHSYHREKLLSYWQVFIMKGTFKYSTTLKLHPNGWQEARTLWKNVPPQVRLQHAHRRMKRHTPSPDFQTHYFSKEYQKLVLEMSATDAKICMVTFPVSFEYAKASQKKPQFKQVFSFFQKFANANNLKYINYFEYYVNNLSYFSDMDHLNYIGVPIFTKTALQDCFNIS